MCEKMILEQLHEVTNGDYVSLRLKTGEQVSGDMQFLIPNKRAFKVRGNYFSIQEIASLQDKKPAREDWQPPKVIIHVLGGVAEVAFRPIGVEVEIIDYDHNEGD